ncbi:MAG: thiol:disulfide interchange protein DsbA/DsbL [Steroidobacteraceae bacterium]
MKQLLLPLALLGLMLAGCGGEPAPSTSTGTSGTPPPAMQTEAPAASAAPAAVEEKAAKTQESAGTETGAERGEAALEKMAALPADAQLPAGPWKVGVNYKPIVPAQTTSAEAGQVEVLEVFWYGCGHCYALDPFLESWHKSKPANAKFVRVPVMWGPVHRAHGKLFYTLEALGKLDTLHTKVFDEIHQRNNFLAANDDAQSMKLQLAFAKANGISEADFTRAYNSFAVNSNLQRAEELTRRYAVEGVPLVIVNGKYQTDVAMAGGDGKLVELINYLVATEKRR